MLETLNREQNVKDMTFSEPKGVEEPFDPTVRITEKAWSYALGSLERNLSNSEYYDFLLLAKSVAIVDPSRLEALPPLNASSIRNFINRVRGRDFSDIISLATSLANLKIVNPQVFKEIGAASYYKWLEDPPSVPRSGGDSNFLNYTANLKIISPITFKRVSYNTSDSLALYIRSAIDETEQPSLGFPLYYETGLASAIKIADPEGYLKLGLNGERWRRLKENYLAKGVYKGPVDYIDWGADMKILAAQEIRITEDSFELIMQGQDEIHNDTPPVPEKRKF